MPTAGAHVEGQGLLPCFSSLVGSLRNLFVYGAVYKDDLFFLDHFLFFANSLAVKK